MNLLSYILITVSLGGISELSLWANDRFEAKGGGPLYSLSIVSGTIFAVMFLLLVAAIIVEIFGEATIP